MIIQWILIAGLTIALGYAFLQRKKSRLVSIMITGISFAGIYFVLYPEQTTNLAHILGVGRGADLVTYCWILINLVISLNLQFKILQLHGVVTELTRELALRNPRLPDQNCR